MNRSAPIHVFIAEDHVIVRKGIRTLLSLEPDIQVVGEAGNGRQTVEQVNQLKPDVILMDLVMPELDGIQAIQHIKESHPDAKVLVLTSELARTAKNEAPPRSDFTARREAIARKAERLQDLYVDGIITQRPDQGPAAEARRGAPAPRRRGARGARPSPARQPCRKTASAPGRG